MHEFLPYAWFEGKCIPFKEAKISIATHALHYGTAAFGGMRAIPNPTNKEEFLLRGKFKIFNEELVRENLYNSSTKTDFSQSLDELLKIID